MRKNLIVLKDVEEKRQRGVRRGGETEEGELAGDFFGLGRRKSWEGKLFRYRFFGARR